MYCVGGGLIDILYCDDVGFFVIFMVVFNEVCWKVFGEVYGIWYWGCGSLGCGLYFFV